MSQTIKLRLALQWNMHFLRAKNCSKRKPNEKQSKERRDLFYAQNLQFCAFLRIAFISFRVVFSIIYLLLFSSWSCGENRANPVLQTCEERFSQLATNDSSFVDSIAGAIAPRLSWLDDRWLFTCNKFA